MSGLNNGDIKERSDDGNINSSISFDNDNVITFALSQIYNYYSYYTVTLDSNINSNNVPSNYISASDNTIKNNYEIINNKHQLQIPIVLYNYKYNNENRDNNKDEDDNYDISGNSLVLHKNNTVDKDTNSCICISIIIIVLLSIVCLSVYTSSGTCSSINVDDNIESLEIKAVQALDNSDIATVREIVADAIAFININKANPVLDVAAFKHILARAENKEQHFTIAESLLIEIKELYEECDTDDLYATVLEDYATSLRGQGRNEEAIQSMHKAALVFDELTVLEEYLNESSPLSLGEQRDKDCLEIISPGSKELSEYLDSFSNIYNTNTTNNVYSSNISNTNTYTNTRANKPNSSNTPKMTYRHHLIRHSNSSNKRPNSPTDLDDFYDFYEDGNENCNTKANGNDENVNPNVNAHSSITYSLKPNYNPILKPKPKRQPHPSLLTPLRSSPSSSFFHNIDKMVISPKTPIKPQYSAAPVNVLSSPLPTHTLPSVKSPFDVTKDLCLSVSTNSVRVRSNIGKMMMDENRFSDANDIFDSVLETCKFLSKQNIDVDSIVKEVTIWKSNIAHSENIVRIDDDDE